VVGARVLAIDDDDQILRLVARLIADAGHEIIATAREGDQAVQHAAALAPDAIVLDYELQGTTASELAPRLKSVCPTAIIVGLSSTEPPDREWCDTFLLKNDVTNLASVLEDALARRSP
jgi:chemotaxis response regulator CheB